jgi:hypothetical protein
MSISDAQTPALRLNPTSARAACQSSLEEPSPSQPAASSSAEAAALYMLRIPLHPGGRTAHSSSSAATTACRAAGAVEWRVLEANGATGGLQGSDCAGRGDINPPGHDPRTSTPAGSIFHLRKWPMRSVDALDPHKLRAAAERTREEERERKRVQAPKLPSPSRPAYECCVAAMRRPDSVHMTRPGMTIHLRGWRVSCVRAPTRQATARGARTIRW